MKDKILNWLANGQVGQSSKAIACCIAGLDGPKSHPYDPDDLNRCLLFLNAVPEARKLMSKVAGLSPAWARLIERWDEIEASFLNEAGMNWCKAQRAPKTYALMKSIRDDA